MVFLYTILNVGIILCSSFWSHAYPRTTDERPFPLSLPIFLHRNSPHLSNHSIQPLNTSLPPLSQAISFRKNHSFFHPNHPLVGTIIPCTSDEKICLRHNMVYVPSVEECRPLGNAHGSMVVIERNRSGHITGRIQYVYNFEYDAKAAENIESGMEVEEEKGEGELNNGEGGGSQYEEGNKGDIKQEDTKDEENKDEDSIHKQRNDEYSKDKNSEYEDSKAEVTGDGKFTKDSVNKHNFNEDVKPMTEGITLSPFYNDNPPCSGYIMAYDGKCYSKNDIPDICGCDVEPVQHVLGCYECNCTEASLIHVEQPGEDGLCRIPDFKFPDLSPLPPSNTPVSLNCSDQQSFCFLINKIWMPENGTCYTPLERGPCPEDHVVALNDSAAHEGFAEGTCVHERGDCPIGYKRLAFNNECYSDRELKIRNIHVRLRPYGLYESVPFWITHMDEGNKLCRIKYINLVPIAPPSEVVAVPENAVQNDRGDIHASSVHANVPKPSNIE